MAVLTQSLLDHLTQSGPRLPWLVNWLSDEVWSISNYSSKKPVDYLQSGERVVNEVEEVIAASAGRIYDELMSTCIPERDLRRFLESGQPCAAVVFDGLSLREAPLVCRLAEQSGLRIVERGWAVSALPSDTLSFIDQRLKVGAISPSQLPGNMDLSSSGISCYHLDQVNQKRMLNPSSPAMLLWSAFPDYRYKERDAKFSELFEQLHHMMMTAWQNTVQDIIRQSPGRRILVTGDHGYVFFGNGCSFPWDNSRIRPLSDYFGGERFARLSEKPNPPVHQGVTVLRDLGIAMIRGRVQTHPKGEASRKLYRHGGLSLMEMLVPWIILESNPT